MPRTRECVDCHEDRPIGQFEGRKHVCNYCKRKRVVLRAVLSEWDWASGLNQQYSQAIGQMHGGRGSYTLNPELLRGLMAQQNCTCPFTGEIFKLPDTLPKKHTLTKWIHTLPENEARRVPILVRVGFDIGWELGNVLFISKTIGELYNYCKGRLGVQSMLRHMVEAKVVIPQREAVMQKARDITSMKVQEQSKKT